MNLLGLLFGNRCSTYQSGDLTKTDKAVDGIFGFGPGALSVISQLSSQGLTPKAFSHCLKGQDNGGGVLVLGEILEPNIVYSPLVPSQYVLSSAFFFQTLFCWWTCFSLIRKYKYYSFPRNYETRYLHYC